MAVLTPDRIDEEEAPPPPRRPTRRRPGEAPAAHVLVAMVVALGLAALVNVDALVERVEREPLGPGRDRALALWHPVQDLSHVLQAHRLRDLGHWLVGDHDDDGRPVDAQDPGVVVPAEVPSSRPELRQPTAAAPLRIWVGGDSMVRDVAESFARLVSGVPTIDAVTHYEISSGLTRPDFYDWPAALARDMAATDPEVVVVMFGANDAQGIRQADGTVHQGVHDPGWQAEYARRVGLVMDQLAAPGRLVLWVGQPTMRDRGYSAEMAALDGIYAAQAEGRPWIDYVDTRRLFGPGGEGEGLRQPDGIHLDREGADLLAQRLLDSVVASIGTD